MARISPCLAPSGAGLGVDARHSFRLGCWLVDPPARELSDGTACRRVSPKAMQVLLQLASAGGSVVSRDALLDAVWPDVVVGEEVLTHAIAELRAALGDASRAPQLIETVRKSGYRLLRQAAAPADPAAPPEPGFELEAHLLCGEAAILREQAGPGQVEHATALCAEAIGRAPSYAPARAAFAVAAVFRRLCCDGGGPDLDSALAQARAAVQLRPDLAAPHAAVGIAFASARRWAEAARAFNRALACEPRDFESHFLYARMLFSSGRMADAARLAECGASLHADDTRVLYLAASAWAAAGEVERARRAAAAGLARSDRRLAENPQERRSLVLGAHFLAMLGRSDAALDRIGTAGMPANPLTIYGAMALAQAGARDVAMKWLEAAVDAGWSDLCVVQADPALAALRAEPRYSRIEARLSAR